MSRYSEGDGNETQNAYDLWAHTPPVADFTLLEQWGGYHEISFGDYSPGRFAWLLADIVPLEEPVPAKGALGLWDWSYPTNALSASGVR